MQSHGPKRVYTPHSLESWFGRLENDWAAAFSASQLEEGRRIYRDGEVRELELTAKDAIIPEIFKAAFSVTHLAELCKD
jgi:hypothetical protein